MRNTENKNIWDTLTCEEKNMILYQKQKALLDTFLEKKAITREQYEKSLHDLTEKMGYTESTGST